MTFYHKWSCATSQCNNWIRCSSMHTLHFAKYVLLYRYIFEDHIYFDLKWEKTKLICKLSLYNASCRWRGPVSNASTTRSAKLANHPLKILPNEKTTGVFHSQKHIVIDWYRWQFNLSMISGNIIWKMNYFYAPEILMREILSFIHEDPIACVDNKHKTMNRVHKDII